MIQLIRLGALFIYLFFNGRHEHYYYYHSISDEKELMYKRNPHIKVWLLPCARAPTYVPWNLHVRTDTAGSPAHQAGAKRSMSMHTVSSELARTALFLLLLSWICTVFTASTSSRPSPWCRRPTTSASASTAGAASRPNLANQTPTTPAMALTLRSATYTAHSLEKKAVELD